MVILNKKYIKKIKPGTLCWYGVKSLTIRRPCKFLHLDQCKYSNRWGKTSTHTFAIVYDFVEAGEVRINIDYAFKRNLRFYRFGYYIAKVTKKEELEFFTDILLCNPDS